MPKRKNSWGSNSPMQLKTHISQKEVNEGVGRDANMQIVYERTKALLFSGARSVNLNSTVQATSNGDSLVSKADANGLGCSTIAKGQLHLGAHGELLRSPQKVLQKGAMKSPCTACAFCVKQAFSGVLCYHCERSACPSCRRQCSLCGNIFCFQCCAVNYDGRDEIMVCSDCMTH